MQTVPARSSPTHGLPVALFIIDEGSCSWLAIYTFSDYATRDENTGRIKQGTKAWSIFEGRRRSTMTRSCWCAPTR